MNVLTFFAHPDDETILAGGALALLAREGHQVHYLSATRGEGGEVGEPPVCSVDELGAVREGELVCAVQALGGRSLTFLDYVDPRVGPDNQLFAYTSDLTMLAGQVAATLKQFEIDVVISHGSNGEYGHPAHQVTHLAARMAVESMSDQRPAFYTVASIYPGHPRPFLANKDDPAHLVLDVSPVLEQKTRAALCHRTQHALFVRRASEEAGRPLTVPEVIQREESLHRVLPEGADLEDDGLAVVLQPYRVEARVD